MHDVVEQQLQQPAPVRRVFDDGASQQRRAAHAPETGTDHRISAPARTNQMASVHRVGSVQVGDWNTTSVNTHHVLHRTVVPAGRLIAENRELARGYVGLVLKSDSRQVAGFLADLLTAAGALHDLDLIGYAEDRPATRGRMFSFFGLCRISDVSGVMLGVGNEMRTATDVHAPAFRGDDEFARRIRALRRRPADETDAS